MRKYMLFFYGIEYKPGEMSTKDYAKSWLDWIKEVGENEKVESSLPFEWNGKMVVGDKVSDLVLKEVDIGGYMLLEAENIDQAIDIAKGAPHMKLGGTTIIRPCAEE